MNRARRHCGSSQTDAGRCCRGVQTRAAPPVRARLQRSGQKTRRGAAAAERGLTQQIKGVIPTLWAFPIRGFTIKSSWILVERKPP
ncbi:hypothetical protein AOLI_G00221820 [Acnodon oligacanthus]